MGAFRCGTVAIAGRPNTGKSSLLNKLVGQRIAIVSRRGQTTRHTVTGILTTADCQYVFVDLPGYQTRHVNVLNRALNRQATEGTRDCDVVVFVVEALRFGAADREVLARIPAGQNVVAAVNKVDLVKDRLELLRVVAELLPEGPAAYPAAQLTDRDERFFAAEILREKLFQLLGEELPYRCDVALESFRQEGRLRRIEATIWVERESQKAIVIGAKGGLLKRISSAARRHMEQLFGGKVYLGVWVKVKRDWTGDERLLRQLGYR